MTLGKVGYDLLKLPVGWRDHLIGWEHAPVTLLEYGDYECPYSAKAEEVIAKLRRTAGADLRFGYRFFPLEDVHEHAKLAAVAAEAAGRQGFFWQMHRALFEQQEDLSPACIHRLAAQLGLDRKRYLEDIQNPSVIARVEEDERLGDEDGVDSTPTFFLNGKLHAGGWEFEELLLAIQHEADLNSLQRAI